ncbi:hypothetical protein B0J17DRAFT_722837 [Rhizoctonia solani]|nr:hypothetical protein B0J17DRAFT_722837 [Rhizoctonia solani]
MPPLRSSASKPGFVEYLENMGEPLPEIPTEYLTSAQEEYSALQPTVATLSEWSAPTWDLLSVPQHLSASLIKTLIEDSFDELVLCSYHSICNKLGIFSWKVANAAAASHLLCSPDDNPTQEDMVYVLNINQTDKGGIPSPPSA